MTDLIEWLLLAQLVGEAEDACVDAGDVFAQGAPAPRPSGFANPPSAMWTRRERFALAGLRDPEGRPLAAIAHDAWTAIHEYLGVKLVDRPLVRDQVVRTFDPHEFPFRLSPRKK